MENYQTNNAMRASIKGITQDPRGSDTDAMSSHFLTVAPLCGMGAHGLMTFNDFKALDGNRQVTGASGLSPFVTKSTYNA